MPPGTEIMNRITRLLDKSMSPTKSQVPWIGIVEKKVDAITNQHAQFELLVGEFRKLLDELKAELKEMKKEEKGTDERQRTNTGSLAGSSNPAAGAGKSVKKTKEKKDE